MERGDWERLEQAARTNSGIAEDIEGMTTHLPGAEVPNHTLRAPVPLEVYSKSCTVDDLFSLSDTCAQPRLSAVGRLHGDQILSKMMYFEDLTRYSYQLKRPIDGVLNIGWLDAAHPFPQAPVEQTLFGKLCDICASEGRTYVHVNKLRGVLPCPLCGSYHFVIPGRKEADLMIGMSKLWLPNPEGGYLAAPSMILHFIADHQYNPPQIFWDAVSQFDLNTPYSGQDVYLKSIAGAF